MTIDPTLPLIELHRHLDGSVRLGTILDLGLKHDLPLPARTLEGLRPHVQVTDPQPGIMVFIAKFEWLIGVMVDYEAVRRIAYEVVEDVKREGQDYAELRFSPWFMAEPHHLDPTEVTAAVIDGVEAASRDLDMPVNLLGILSRTYGPQACAGELEALLAHRDHIAGLDLAGDEANYPGEMFRQHFVRARDAGWAITAHAGEATGADSVWQALRELGARRIGHALRAVDDPALLDYMAEQRIGIESCLTSNVQTSCVADFASHPLRCFLEAGIPATISTDDPGISAIDLRHEYEIAAPAAGLSADQIRQAQANALEVAFLGEEQKRALREKKSGKR